MREDGGEGWEANMRCVCVNNGGALCHIRYATQRTRVLNT